MFISWNLEEAVAFCRAVEAVAPQFGAHVALTGGTLYCDGPRKDCDIVLYRIRERETPIDFDGLFAALIPLGAEFVKDYGWCKKIKWNGKPVDVFDPEDDGEYPHKDPADMPRFDDTKAVAGVDDFSQFEPIVETA
jgi:hypothetical protein